MCVGNTHGDLHRQQPLARVFGVDGELHRQRGGNTGGVQAGTARTHLTGIMGGENLHLVRTERETGGGALSTVCVRGKRCFLTYSMCVSLFVYTCTCAHTCVTVCRYACFQVYIHLCVYVCKHACVRACVPVRVCMLPAWDLLVSI